LKQANQKRQGKGQWEGNKGLGGGPRKTTHKRRVPFHIVVWRIEKQNWDGRRERRGFFGGARKKGIKIGTREQKPQTLNIPRETRRVLPGVVLGGPSHIGSPFNSFHQAC